MEEDIHGPGIDADGAAFPGTNLYVAARPRARLRVVGDLRGPEHHRHVRRAAVQPERRRGLDQLRLLPAARPVRADADADAPASPGQPNLADSTPAGSVTLQTQRTAYGIVIARATIHGQPGRLHEPALDLHARARLGARLLAASTTRRRCATRSEFIQRRLPDRLHVQLVLHRRQAHRVLQLGAEPGARAAHRSAVPELGASTPGRAYHGAAAVTPSSLTERQTPQSAHPQVIDQSYLTSWNNKQAPGYNDTATAQQYSSVYRSQLLDNNIEHYLADQPRQARRWPT